MTRPSGGSADPLGDAEMSWPVAESTTEYGGGLITIRRDLLEGADGESFGRDIVVHPGAVAILAIDDEERVLVVTQYRHPARQRLVELPAGVLDQAGEDPLTAARRELAEEGQVQAERWTQLLTLMPSPGISTEVLRLYLAEGVSDTTVPEGFVAQHEESAMTRSWVPLDELVEAVLARRVTNAALVAGVLAARVTRGLPRS